MDFEQFKIKEYEHWDLFLDAKQFPFIGRSYAWAKREEATQVVDMNTEERIELFDLIVPAWNKTVKKLFDHDWPNVACLGNTAPHLHWHLIPRYHSSREFYGIEFIDPNPKGNYSPYPKKELPLETLLKIRDDMRSKIDK